MVWDSLEDRKQTRGQAALVAIRNDPIPGTCSVVPCGNRYYPGIETQSGDFYVGIKAKKRVQVCE